MVSLKIAKTLQAGVLPCGVSLVSGAVLELRAWTPPVQRGPGYDAFIDSFFPWLCLEMSVEFFKQSKLVQALIGS